MHWPSILNFLSGPSRAALGHVVSEPPRRARILVADGYSCVLLTVAETIRYAGHDVIKARTVREALAHLDASVPDAAILDRQLDHSALPVVERLASLSVPFVFLTADWRSDYGWGVHETASTLRKPATAKAIVDAVEHLLS